MRDEEKMKNGEWGGGREMRDGGGKISSRQHAFEAEEMASLCIISSVPRPLGRVTWMIERPAPTPWKGHIVKGTRQSRISR